MTGYTNEDFYAALAYVKNSRASEEGEKKKNENIGRATEKAKEESEVVCADEKKETGGAGFGLDFTVLEEIGDVYGIPAHNDFPIQYEERRYCCMKCPSDNDDIQFRTVHMFQLHYKEKHNIDKSSSDASKQLLFVCYYCSKTFDDYKMQLEHRVMHEESYCSYCDAFQSTPYILRRHVSKCSLKTKGKFIRNNIIMLAGYEFNCSA